MSDIKLFFNLEENLDDAAVESVWASLNADGSLKIKNIPIHINGISYGDDVTYVIKDNIFVFDKVIKKHGHSTYRILQLKDDPKSKFDQYWTPIQQLGCSYESKVDGDRILYAVDVPPEADLDHAYRLMESGENEGIWHFEEADYGRPKSK